ncbi:hypothetical protein SS50377_26569 [Spironucleus salmonicida]|uniref:Uncharacterized protein n=1 Tax=Spironucleus salmonicida TaxID=348837 RepID=V6LB17_9EUKA|nr:hypothetical protein SS50377_26569 [Spironucleus salmonicida]|eukprot:EST41423.1 Hypothetical protein SS50377_19140 [Spironucleus salmonicida]
MFKGCQKKPRQTANVEIFPVKNQPILVENYSPKPSIYNNSTQLTPLNITPKQIISKDPLVQTSYMHNLQQNAQRAVAALLKSDTIDYSSTIKTSGNVVQTYQLSHSSSQNFDIYPAEEIEYTVVRNKNVQQDNFELIKNDIKLSGKFNTLPPLKPLPNISKPVNISIQSLNQKYYSNEEREFLKSIGQDISEITNDDE